MGAVSIFFMMGGSATAAAAASCALTLRESPRARSPPPARCTACFGELRVRRCVPSLGTERLVGERAALQLGMSDVARRGEGESPRPSLCSRSKMLGAAAGCARRVRQGVDWQAVRACTA